MWTSRTVAPAAYRPFLAARRAGCASAYPGRYAWAGDSAGQRGTSGSAWSENSSAFCDSESVCR